MNEKNLLIDNLLMPPPPSKKRPRSITIYSEEEAYSRIATVPETSNSNNEWPTEPSPSIRKSNLVTPSPHVLSKTCDHVRPRRAFHTFHPRDTCVKSLSSSMTQEFQFDDPRLKEDGHRENSTPESVSFTINFESGIQNGTPLCDSFPRIEDKTPLAVDKENSVEPCSLFHDEAMDRKVETPNSENDDDNDDSPRISTRFSDIIGHGGAKLRLEETILPLALPSSLAHTLLTGLRSAPASILLHGPPGCGKTQLARAVAGEAQAAFISVGPSDILSKYVGESEASIRNLFRYARERAMKMSSRCAVLFFDEIDALGQTRSSSGDRNNVSGGETSARRILAELLIQLSKNYNQDDVDMIEEKMSRSDEDISHRENLQQKSPHSTLHLAVGRQVITPVDGNAPQSLEIDITEMRNDERKPRIIVIAATNRPEDCDPALLRRFHARILVGLPTKRDRKKIVSRLLSNIDHSLTDNHVLQIALATDGWSGSDLESLTREAVMTPIRECLQAAARIKASARKHNPKGELDSNPNHEIDLNRNSDRAARDALLAGFKSLRSVHIQDFEQAMAFWLGEDHFQILGETVTTKANTHYDSDSSSEDTNF